MFFTASKIFWSLIQPLNALCFLAIIGFLIRFKRNLAGQKIMNAALIMIVAIGVLPIGPALITFLERQYPTPASLPERIDGIIVLGGAFEARLSETTGHIVANDQIERMLCFVDLAKQHPSAKLVFSGGTGDMLYPDAKESVAAKKFFNLAGLNDKAILYESKSRNTYENVLYSMQMLDPSNAENWVVITSAFHMPRSMGIFTHFGWKVIPYQCDPKTDGRYTFLKTLPNISGNLYLLNVSLKEIIGSIVYYITDKSAFILPSSSVKVPT